MFPLKPKNSHLKQYKSIGYCFSNVSASFQKRKVIRQAKRKEEKELCISMIFSVTNIQGGQTLTEPIRVILWTVDSLLKAHN